MKFYFILILLALSFSGFSQTFDEDQSAIIESETKSALGRLYYTANANTGNYNVKYHKLDFTIDPAIANISGIVTTHFEAKENMSQIIFDLTDNMNVSQVLQDGNPVPLTFSQNNDELVINLASTVNQGQTGIVNVTYSGTPQYSGFDSFEASTHNGDPVLWTLSEPYGARDWWPCKQDLNDKIDSLDVYITTPQYNSQSEEYIAVSNGVEQSQTINGLNKTTHFKHQYPIPAYLIAIAATNYRVYSHTVPNNGNPFNIVNYVYPENLTAETNTAVTVPIMELYSNLFEEYPYASEKYGHAQFGWGGGMEHTTVSFMGSFSRNLIAHELAHQWFGDKITCGSWKDIWLNEGFATYLSGLVIENFDGNAAFAAWKQQRVNSITSAIDGAVYLSDQDTTSVGRIFSGRLSYDKGSMVLHMLRKKLGDTNFYQGIQNYLSDPNLAFNYAKTQDFITIMELASGLDLTEFFNDWLYNQGYPSYNIEWTQPNPSQVQIRIDQNQSHPSVSFFEAPVTLRLNGTNSETQDIVLENTSNGQVFLEGIMFNVANIQFDPEFDLISNNNSVVLGLNDEFPGLQFSVFPNPANTEIFIQKPNDLVISNIRIRDILGRLVLESPFQDNLNIESLSTGLHFLTFTTNKGFIHKRLLKQ